MKDIFKDFEETINKYDLLKLELIAILREKVLHEGTEAFSIRCGIKYSDTCAWMNRKRKWSFEKMMKLYRIK